MIKTFIPRDLFLRVDEKFFPAFIYEDDRVPGLAKSLYGLLFHLRNTGRLDLPQEDIARRCGCSVKTAQQHIKLLAELGYLAIYKRGARGGSGNVYELVLSEFIQERAECLPPDREAQNLRLRQEEPVVPRRREGAKTAFFASESECAPGRRTERHRERSENFTPRLIKNLREKESPLPPLPTLGEAEENREAEIPLVETSGSGQGQDKRSAWCRYPWPERQEDFLKLWNLWPVHKERKTAERAFHRLARKEVLPPLGDLLEAVARMRTEDAHWKNGYAPLLANWLRREGWTDEPFVRPQRSETPDKALEAKTGVESGTTVNETLSAATGLHTAADFSWMREEFRPISLENARNAARFMRPETAQAFLLKVEKELKEYEYGHDKKSSQGHGQSRIPGLSGGYPGDATQRLQLDHDPQRHARPGQDEHGLGTVLALYERQNREETPARPWGSAATQYEYRTGAPEPWFPPETPTSAFSGDRPGA